MQLDIYLCLDALDDRDVYIFNLQRSPVVGILTRHDFMPEHILGLHPGLLKSRWKRLRWQRGAVAKYFRSLIVWVANTG